MMPEAPDPVIRGRQNVAPNKHFNYSINMDTKTAVAALGALAQETRLDIFRQLVRAGPAGLPVGTIAARLGVEANGRLSFHLKELVGAGLASSSQSGRFVYYAANYPAMNALLAHLTEACCAGEPCGAPPPLCSPFPTAHDDEARDA